MSGEVHHEDGTVTDEEGLLVGPFTEAPEMKRVMVAMWVPTDYDTSDLATTIACQWPEYETDVTVWELAQLVEDVKDGTVTATVDKTTIQYGHLWDEKGAKR